MKRTESKNRMHLEPLDREANRVCRVIEKNFEQRAAEDTYLEHVRESVGNAEPGTRDFGEGFLEILDALDRFRNGEGSLVGMVEALAKSIRLGVEEERRKARFEARLSKP